MIVKAKFKKALPARTGQGRNGAYDFRPFIIEYEEDNGRGGETHSLCVEISAKKAKVDELTKICGSDREIELYLGFDVEEGNGRWFNRVIVFVRENDFKLERSY